MSMYRVFSCVVGRGCLLWPVHFLGKTLLVFALPHSIFQGEIACYSRCFLTSYFCIPAPYNEKDIFFVYWATFLQFLVFCGLQCFSVTDSWPFCGFPFFWSIRCPVASLSFLPQCWSKAGLWDYSWSVFICLCFGGCGDNLLPGFVVNVDCELLVLMFDCCFTFRYWEF